jgi:peptidoglycan/LPS O-acetylase OafA/YrhL
MAIGNKQDSPRNSKIHFFGVDTIRFLSAVIVVATHTGFYAPSALRDAFGLPGRILVALIDNFINGQGAVMVFFVVSGLCIHMPQVGGRGQHWTAFLARRYLRLGVPFAAAWVISPLLQTQIFNGVNPLMAILWTLLLEALYYTSYPALALAARRWGWSKLIWFSLPVSLLLLLSHPEEGHPGRFGTINTTLIYLPVWLLGCQLAESLAVSSPAMMVSRFQVWSLRVFMGLSLVISKALIFHAPGFLPPVRFPLSVLVVGFVAGLWLSRELRWCQSHPPFRVLEWCGAWSYSLYLTHLTWFDVWTRLTKVIAFPAALTPFNFLFQTMFIFALAACFYYLCEKPSHRFARAAGLRIDRWLEVQRTS